MYAFPKYSIISALTLSLLGGCASTANLARELQREFEYAETERNGRADAGKVIFSDAKQRAVLAGRLKREGDSDRDPILVMCAEPSPDALSAISEVGSLRISAKDKADLASQIAFSEASASIGLRTQSIQLMRDAMFRLCEGYLSGALSDSSFETLHRRFQHSMVAILAIEQLTGAVRAPAATLGGASSAGVDPDKALSITNAVDAARKDALVKKRAAEEAAQATTEAKGELATLQAELEQMATDAPERAAKEQEVGAAKAEVAQKQEDQAASESAHSDADETLASLERTREAVLAGSVSSLATASVQTMPYRATNIAEVAKAVQEISTTMLNRPFEDEVCATVLNSLMGMPKEKFDYLKTQTFNVELEPSLGRLTFPELCIFRSQQQIDQKLQLAKKQVEMADAAMEAANDQVNILQERIAELENRGKTAQADLKVAKTELNDTQIRERKIAEAELKFLESRITRSRDAINDIEKAKKELATARR